MEKEQIEEMAIGLEEEFVLCGTLSSCGTKRCSQCFSKYLYEQGYRKLPEDSVVLRRNEAIGSPFYVRGYQDGSKETAEKIFNDIFKLEVYDDGWNKMYYKEHILELAKQFGLEVEE